MATPVKSIEREFLLATAMREKSRIVMSAGGGDWTVRILAVDRTKVTFAHEIPLQLLGKGSAYDFRYDVRGQTVAFKTSITEPGERRFTAAMPEQVFKNLSRRFLRMPPPGDLAASFAFAGERFDLDFPPSAVFNPDKEPEASPDFDPADLRGLMAEFERKALAIASDRGIVMFKDRKPQSPEERLAAATGRCFYLPTAISGLPKSDPFAERTILTRDDFLQFYVDSGVEPEFAEAEVAKLERSKRSSSVLSELIVPILFQDYAIGYASVVNKQAGRPPFDLGAIETFQAFARVFSWSLKLHGYFKDAPRLDDDFRLQVVDVSAGGLLFACGEPRLIQALKEGSSVTVRLNARRRAVDASGTIRRHYAGSKEGYFGIEFHAMAPEDFRFLFEYLYGRPFGDDDSDSVEGARIVAP
ncbi:MAG: PilZ domain-containing protein [Spirochaetes bacterium]|nr:PilZ domain-containing protein [Spirochaetota bacterium]MBU1079954.1 PilZ domain-containing protein [Spirochaetota bacterium]